MEKLRAYLDRSGKSIEQFAFEIRVDVSTVYRYLAGTRKPDGRIAMRIHTATSGYVSLADLLGERAA